MTSGSTEPNRNEGNEKDKEAKKNKLTETIDKFKKCDKLDEICTYAKCNVRDTIAYVVLVIGLIWLFFSHFIGGLIVGFIAGLYFYREIVWVIQNFNAVVEKQGIVRCLILGGTLLGFFIVVPSIFIGAAVGVAMKLIFGGPLETE